MYEIFQLPESNNSTEELVFMLVSCLHSLQFNLVWLEKSLNFCFVTFSCTSHLWILGCTGKNRIFFVLQNLFHVNCSFRDFLSETCRNFVEISQFYNLNLVKFPT